jgi:hypothetical protein
MNIYIYKLIFVQIDHQDEVDPFAMPNWRKVLYSILFFIMVAAAEIGNIIGNARRCFR